ERGELPRQRPGRAPAGLLPREPPLRRLRGHRRDRAPAVHGLPGTGPPGGAADAQRADPARRGRRDASPAVRRGRGRNRRWAERRPLRGDRDPAPSPVRTRGSGPPLPGAGHDGAGRARGRDRRADARGEGQAEDSRGHPVWKSDAAAREGAADAAHDVARRPADAHLRGDAVEVDRIAARAARAVCRGVRHQGVARAQGLPRQAARAVRWSGAARRLWLAAAFVAVVGLGCETLFAPTTTEEERQAYAAAQTARAADPAKGRAALESFLARYPESPLAADAALALGDLARSAGRVDEARRRYAEAVERGGAASDRARVQLAAIEIERGDTAAARRWLDRVRLSRLERADLRNAYRAFAETAARPADRVRWLALLRGEVTDPAEAAAIDAQTDRVLGELPV